MKSIETLINVWLKLSQNIGCIKQPCPVHWTRLTPSDASRTRRCVTRALHGRVCASWPWLWFSLCHGHQALIHISFLYGSCVIASWVEPLSAVPKIFLPVPLCHRHRQTRADSKGACQWLKWKVKQNNRLRREKWSWLVSTVLGCFCWPFWHHWRFKCEVNITMARAKSGLRQVNFIIHIHFSLFKTFPPPPSLVKAKTLPQKSCDSPCINIKQVASLAKR